MTTRRCAPWIGTLTSRLCLDKLRAGGREQPIEEAEEISDFGDAFAELDEALAVREAMKDLPEHCAEILDRFFSRDESYKTIGEALDIPAGTIASRISRCLSQAEIGARGKKTPIRPVWGPMTQNPSYDEERIADLLAALPPAPEGWVQAAQELPAARRDMDEIVARAEADQRFREAAIADLEAALAAEGYDVDERAVAGPPAAAHRRLASAALALRQHKPSCKTPISIGQDGNSRLRLPPVGACRRCGAQGPPEAVYCLKCGLRLIEVPQAESRKPVSVLFNDVVHSTALGERLEPESLRRVMWSYYETVAAVCERHGGWSRSPSATPPWRSSASR